MTRAASSRVSLGLKWPWLLVWPALVALDGARWMNGIHVVPSPSSHTEENAEIMNIVGRSDDVVRGTFQELHPCQAVVRHGRCRDEADLAAGVRRAGNTPHIQRAIFAHTRKLRDARQSSSASGCWCGRRSHAPRRRQGAHPQL